jgi:outer membrane protein assembly factor BamB
MDLTKAKTMRKLWPMIAIFLMLTMAIPLTFLATTSAHTPSWNIPSFAYLAAQPSPVGIGQTVQVYMWVDAPFPSAAEGNDIRRHDYKLTITAPDGSIDVKTWPIIWDTTGVQYHSFAPDQVGTYTLLFEYPSQLFTWNTTAVRAWNGDTFMADNATATVIVQQEPLSAPVLSYPLPSEYWSRPIEGQNTDWYSISSNWLNAPFILVGDSGTQGAVSSCDTQGGYGRFQPDGIAPNSPHVLWTRPIQDGGVVGGDIYELTGETYYMGGSYNVRFRDAIVMYGRLYFEESWGNSGSGGDFICVDLQTGQELWRINATTIASVGKPVMGYLYCYDMMNQHGIIPNGLLFTQNFARAYDPMTGRVLGLNITNVPNGMAASGPQGEVLRYVYNSAAKSLGQWNSSKVFVVETSGTIDASTAARYDWNKTLSIGPGTWTPIRHLISDNLLLLTQGSFGGPRDPQPGMNVTAVSIKAETAGQILWTKYYPVAPNNETRKIMAIDEDAGTFITQDKESLRLTAFSIVDGSQVWTVEPDNANWDTMRSTSLSAYGNLYVSGFDGILSCYDMKNGDLLWTYGNGGEGNTTYSGLETAWGHYPIFVDVIADGKIYLGTSEHSPDSPFYKGTDFRCINASTGEEMWTMMGWGTGMYVGQSDIVAEGSFIYLNCYDMQIYTVGKGPSAMTIEAPKASIDLGKSLIISGTVTDISAGTKQKEQAARFPLGVPAVSDASQSAWMEYIYMQKPRPTDATGVPIALSVVDANGNYRDIGTTTSNADGFFAFNWKPDIDGQFTVYASFAGSESYWPSHAVTAFAVNPAAVTPAPTETPQSDIATNARLMTTMAIGVAAIIIAIAIVGLLLLRKRP